MSVAHVLCGFVLQHNIACDNTVSARGRRGRARVCALLLNQRVIERGCRAQCAEGVDVQGRAGGGKVPIASSRVNQFGLLEPRVFALSLLVDGDIGIGIFPESEEIIVGLTCCYFVADHHLRPAKLEMR